MTTNLGSSERKHITFDLNVEPTDDDNYDSPASLDLCSICREPLVNNPDNHRTLVTLKCSHKFHLGNFFTFFVSQVILFIFLNINLYLSMSSMKYSPFQFVFRTMDP